MPLTLQQNISLAAAALNHVVATLSLGAGNRIDNLQQDAAQIEIARMRRDVELLQGDTPIHRLVAMAKVARAGNCGEQAMLAFQFLKSRGVSPLDIMNFTDGDHAWVVIGRDANADEDDWDEWGAAAVVCDPWHAFSGDVGTWAVTAAVHLHRYASQLRFEGPANPIVKSFEI